MSRRITAKQRMQDEAETAAHLAFVVIVVFIGCFLTLATVAVNAAF